MKTVLLFAVALSLSLNVGAQQDSLPVVNIPVADLRFHSSFEANLFNQLYTGQNVDYLGFFVAADTAGTARGYDSIQGVLNAFIKACNKEGIGQKPPKKQIKKLYASVHDGYLDKYEIQNQFTAVFKDGRYNCVSGTALFAYVFTQLNIPYTIEEFPTHVMLIAYPEGEQIAVETTDPADGTLQFTPKMKRAFADNLRAQKMISEAEYAEGPEAVFQKNYLVNEKINFRELAGIQYSNNAIYALENDDFVQALNFALKSYVLYPVENTRSLIITSAASILENGNVKDTNRVRALSMLTHFKGGEVIDDYFFNQLSDIVNKVMLAEQDTVQFSNACAGILARTTDIVFRNKIALFYNYEMGRLYTLKKDFKTGVTYAAKAQALDTVNIQVSALTSGCITAWLGQFSVLDAVHKLDSLADIYPNLAYAKDLKNVRIEAYLRLFGFLYYEKRVSEAEAYKAKFEALVNAQNFRKLRLPSETFTWSYKEGAFYYYRNRQYKKAQKILKDGLAIDPENIQLAKLLADFN